MNQTFFSSPAVSPLKGRGSSSNPANRFDKLAVEQEHLEGADENISPKTEFFKDTSQTIVSRNDSPDIPFAYSINPYRGCEHGCVYCYARPTHEYLGFSAGLDFETKIMVKKDAPQLLRKMLSRPGWVPQPVALSGNTDCYQPVERKLQITRACLSVFSEFCNPVMIITKNFLVTRDLDYLKCLAEVKAVSISISVTSLKPDLTRILEPRASMPERRILAIKTLAKAGIPVGVLLAPVIPGLNDQEIFHILQACADAGARFADYVMLRLPHAVKELFEQWLDLHFPTKKKKILNLIRDMRGGKLYQPHFGTRMKGEGFYAEQIKQWFALACQKAGLIRPAPKLSTDHFKKARPLQMSLFD